LKWGVRTVQIRHTMLGGELRPLRCPGDRPLEWGGAWFTLTGVIAMRFSLISRKRGKLRFYGEEERKKFRLPREQPAKS
jgi:hypothetical protein